jgi:hypothetical protein
MRLNFLFFVMFMTLKFDCQASYIYLNCPLPYLPINPATGNMVLPSIAKRIKLDIGLSHNAPNSELWLRKWVVLLFATWSFFFAFSSVSHSNEQLLSQVS